MSNGLACNKKLFNSARDCWCSDCLNIKKIPAYSVSFEEISRQMKVNVDILKKEISDHCDVEIQRFKNEISNLGKDAHL